jgi:NDP-sugar pyrophosphorylase family protein
MTNFKVLLTASGTGSRLGNLTKFTNKSLVRVGNKPAISYIIERYPENVEMVVTIGYFGDHVKEFLELSFPNRKFDFVHVDKFEGEGSSLGYSMLKAKEYLQCPFVFHACDTIVLDDFEISVKNNWCGGFKLNESENYRSFNIIGNTIKKFNEKGENKFDYVYIGVCGIFDYDDFWKRLNLIYNENPNFNELSDVHVIQSMIYSKKFESKEFKNWYDIGNIDSLNKAREKFKSNFSVLDKDNESIFFQNGQVIKFFSDENIVNKRVKRSEILKNVVPVIKKFNKHFYVYDYVEGDLFSRVVDENNFKEFLNWCKINLWMNKNIDIVEYCKNFYFDKTFERIRQFEKKNNILDTENLINGIHVPKIYEMIELIDMNWFCNNQCSVFHGDLILDNVIKTKDGFKLIDWRQDFGGRIDIGDMYYDLGKLNHNLVFNHDIVNDGHFKINIDVDKIFCDIHVSYNLMQFRKILQDFVNSFGFDMRKVNIMTSLIWINMAPLHEYPLDMFLFYFGKINLWKNLV